MEERASLPEERILHKGKHFIIMGKSSPVTPGHLLIVSNEIRKDYFELKRSEIKELNKMIQLCKQIIEKDFQPAGYNIEMNSFGTAGQTLSSFHCSVIPKFMKEDIKDLKTDNRHVGELKRDMSSETNQVDSNKIQITGIKRNILRMNPGRGRKLAELLHNKFITTGIHGRNDMPEDEPPKGVATGSPEHLNFITLTVSIDYMRDAPALWNNSRKTFSDPETRYLFYPKEVEKARFEKVVKDMQKHRLSQRPARDATIWHTISTTLARKWDGDPLNFVKSAGWDSLKILERLENDKHLSNYELLADFPNLRGSKIGPLWIRMLKDNVGLTQLINLDKVSIPIDIHVARATLTTGVLSGYYKGSITALFPEIRAAWAESVKGVTIKGRPMIMLDVDEPLWHLSKYGCSRNRDKVTGTCSVKERCEAKDFCISGVVSVDNTLIELNT